jgi:hypothetical protein
MIGLMLGHFSNQNPWFRTKSICLATLAQSVEGGQPPCQFLTICKPFPVDMCSMPRHSTLLNFDGFSASTLQRQVEMMLIYMKSGSVEPSISLELQSLDYK